MIVGLNAVALSEAGSGDLAVQICATADVYLPADNPTFSSPMKS